MTTKTRTFALALALVLLSACAHFGIKQKATVTLQGVHAVLSEAQDFERLAYASGSIANLTAERHAQFSLFFAGAFDAEIKAAEALKVWRAGDPPPSNLDELMMNVREALTVAQTLTAGGATDGVLSRLHQAITKTQEVMDAMGGR